MRKQIDPWGRSVNSKAILDSLLSIGFDNLKPKQRVLIRSLGYDPYDESLRPLPYSSY